jgi:hypothetical protein
VEEDEICAQAREQAEKSPELVMQAFRMFQGEPREVTLRFRDRLIGLLYDKFGEGLRITRLDNQWCEAQVTVQISMPFWSWLFMMQEDLSLVGPDDLIKEYRVHLSNALNKMS